MRPFLETSCLNTTKKVTKLTNCILSLKEVMGSAQKSGKKAKYSGSFSFECDIRDIFKFISKNEQIVHEFKYDIHI